MTLKGSWGIRPIISRVCPESVKNRGRADKKLWSIEFIYDNIDKINIKDSVRKKLIEGKESAYLSKHF
jgi:5'-3' exonuclease